MQLSKVEDKLRIILKENPKLMLVSNTDIIFKYWRRFEPVSLELSLSHLLTPAESITRCFRKIKNNPLSKIEEQEKFIQYSKN